MCESWKRYHQMVISKLYLNHFPVIESSIFLRRTNLLFEWMELWRSVLISSFLQLKMEWERERQTETGTETETERVSVLKAGPNLFSIRWLTLKRLGGQFTPLSPLCGFSKNVSSKEKKNLLLKNRNSVFFFFFLFF